MASVVFSLLHSLRFIVRSRASLHLEIVALPDQLAVMNRSRRPRLRLSPFDRMLWAWLSRSWRGWRSAVHIVKPETVVAWHRRGFRLFWTWKSRHRTGRPPVSPDVRALIREMSAANPLWGAPRIHGELRKLGISVSQSTVAAYMRRHPRPPSQMWRTFLANHVNQIMAADLFVVPTVTFRLLFVLVVLAHDRRRICPRGGHRASNRGLDGTATEKRLSGERGAPVSAPRSRFGLCTRRDYHRADEHSRGANGAAIAVAERLRGARDRFDPTRVRRIE